jgi:hypothetical protein
MHPATREWKRQQEEQMRKLAETEKQWQLGQIRGAQIVERAKQEELRVAKEQERQKTESVGQMKNAEQVVSQEKDEPDNPETRDAYGSNVAATPISFVSLPPAQKAVLHWAASQEYLNVHKTNGDYKEAAILAEIHGMTTDAILKINRLRKNWHRFKL